MFSRLLEFIKENKTAEFFQAWNGDQSKIGLVKEVDDEWRGTLLHWACIKGNMEIVAVLLEAKALLNTKDRIGRTPLHYACRHGHYDIANLLISKITANDAELINALDKQKATALSLSVLHKHAEVILLLLSRGALVGHNNSDHVEQLTEMLSSKKKELVIEKTSNGEYRLTSSAGADTEAAQTCTRLLLAEPGTINFLLDQYLLLQSDSVKQNSLMILQIAINLIDSDFLRKSDEEIRQYLEEQNNLQLTASNIMTPIRATFSQEFTSSHPEVLAAFEQLKLALHTHEPAFAKLSEESGVLAITQGINRLTFSGSGNKSTSSRPMSLHSSLISPMNLEPQLKASQDESVSKHDEVELDHELAKLESNFQCYYDDSSDSEDEEDNTLDPLQHFKNITEKGSNDYEDDFDKRISFYIHVLGVMTIRSIPVNRVYRAVKRDHLKAFDDNNMVVIKNKVQEVFGEANLDRQKAWQLFLKNFRKYSKESLSLSEITKKSVEKVFKSLKGIESIRGDNEIVVENLATNILEALPTQRKNQFNQQYEIIGEGKDVYYQLFAVTRLLYRLTRRASKEEQDMTPNSKFKIDMLGTTLCEDFSLNVQDGNCFRRDNLDMGFKTTAYPQLLSFKDKREKRTFPSIAKYTYDNDSGERTDAKFTQHLRKVSNGTKVKKIDSKDENSYFNFLRKFYYLLQRTEVGRNPGVLVINMMLFELIEGGQVEWQDVLPGDKDEQQLDSEDCPGFMHPMTFAGAPKAAAKLINSFNKKLEPALKYYPHIDLSGINKDEAKVIAEKTTSIVKKWFSCIQNSPLEECADDEILGTLFEKNSSYYLSS